MAREATREADTAREDFSRFLRANQGARERLWRNLTHWRKSSVDYLVVGLGLALSLRLLAAIVAARGWDTRSALATVSWSITLLCAVLFGLASMLLDDWEQPTRAWARAWWVFNAGAAFSALMTVPGYEPWGWVRELEPLLQSAFSLSSDGFFLYSALLSLDRERARRQWLLPIGVTASAFLLTVAFRRAFRDGAWQRDAPDAAVSIAVLLILVWAHLKALNRVVANVEDEAAKRIVRAVGGAWLSIGYVGYGLVQVLLIVKSKPSLQAGFKPFVPAALALFASGVPLIFLTLRYVERANNGASALAKLVQLLPVPAFLDRVNGARIGSLGERKLLEGRDAAGGKAGVWSDDPTYAALRTKALEGGLAEGRVVVAEANGDRHTVDLVLFPIPGEQLGSGVVGLYTDTSVRAIERALEESFRELVVESEGDLAARMATKIAEVLNARAWSFLLVGADERSLVSVGRSQTWEQEPPASIALADFRGSGGSPEFLWTSHPAGEGPYDERPPATLSSFEGCVLVTLCVGPDVVGALLARAPRLPMIEHLRRARFNQFTTALASLLLRSEFMELTPFVDAFARFDPRQDVAGISATLGHVVGSLAGKVGVRRWALIVGGHDPAGDPSFAIASGDWRPHLRPSLSFDEFGRLVTDRGPEAFRALSPEESRVLLGSFFTDPPPTHNVLALPIGAQSQGTCGVLLLMNRGDDTAPLPFTRANLRVAKQHAAVCELMLRSIVMNRQILREWDWTVHELSNPLFGIRSEARGARLHLAAGETAKALRRLDALELNGTLMTRVLDEFELIHGGEGTRYGSFRPVRLVGDLLMPVRSEVVPFLKERRFSIDEIRIDESAWASPLLLDAELMKAAFFNLFKNAIKFAHPQPSRFRIVVGTRRTDDGGIAISVADEGVGVPEGEEARIFERGYRATNALALGTLGRGLGLAVVRRVLHEHGGSVTLVRRAGPTEFSLNLPRSRVIA